MSLQLATEENAYAAAFRALLGKLDGAEPSWLQRARETAFARFERIGFPTVALEDWKYTNVAPIVRSRFTPVLVNGLPRARDKGFESFFYDETRRSRLVFVNGVFQKELSSGAALPAGVEVIDLRDALSSGKHESRVREHFE